MSFSSLQFTPSPLFTKRLNVRVIEYDFEREYFEQIFEAITISNNDDEIQLQIGELREFSIHAKTVGYSTGFQKYQKN